MLTKLLVSALVVTMAYAAVEPPPPPGDKPVDVPHKLECRNNEMIVKIPKEGLRFARASDLRLLNPLCLPKDDGKNFVFEFDLDKCGTKVDTSNKDDLIYRNKVLGKIVPKAKISHRIKDVEIKLQCNYPRNKALISENIEPNQAKFRSKSEEDGKFTFSMSLYKNKEFNETVGRDNNEFDLRQRLYVQVKVKSNRKLLSILAENCYATPTPKDDPPRHNIIINSCKADNTYSAELSLKKNVQRFSVETFRFTKGNPKHIYIHCHVIACDGKKADSVCAKGCQKKPNPVKPIKREFDAPSGMKTFKLMEGPLAVNDALPEMEEGLN